MVPGKRFEIPPTIKEIVLLGELWAASSIIMALLFVLVDLGRPDRFWHILPVVGQLNFPQSILAWDVLVLNLYFAVNFIVATHILYRAFHGRKYVKQLVVPLVPVYIQGSYEAWPTGATWLELYGVSLLCGVGFTISLFIGELAFPQGALAAQVRIGVITGSLLSSTLGMALLRLIKCTDGRIRWCPASAISYMPRR